MRILVEPRVADNAAASEPARSKTFPRRKVRRQYVCSCCKYKSVRQFNVLRHERRIHAPRPYARICCDEYFYTKGEYYLHVEKTHPEKRMSAVTSRKKYKILKNMSHISRLDYAENNTYTWVEKMVHTRRFSQRLQKKNQGEEESKIELRFENSSVLADDLEDVPLIYFLKNQKLKAYMKNRWSGKEISGSTSCRTASYRSTVVRKSLANKEEFCSDLDEELNNNVVGTIEDWQDEGLDDCRHDVLEETQFLRIVHTQGNVEFEDDRFSGCDFSICQDNKDETARADPEGEFRVFHQLQDNPEEHRQEEEEEEEEDLDTDLLTDSGTSSLTESRTSSLTGSMTGLVTESLKGSLTISQTISQTITQTSSLTRCSGDTPPPLKTRMLEECLPLKKRGVKSFESIDIASFWQTGRNGAKRKPKKSRAEGTAPDENKENDNPKESHRKTSANKEYERVRSFSSELGAKNPMNITFENIANLPVVTQYHRDFLEFIDFDKFKTF